MSPANNNNIFALNATPYNLPKSVSCKIPKLLSVYNGTETLSHLGPKNCVLVLQELKQSVSIGGFKSKIKKWDPSYCHCKLCKNIYIKEYSTEKTYSHKFSHCFYCYQTYL